MGSAGQDDAAHQHLLAVTQRQPHGGVSVIDRGDAPAANDARAGHLSPLSERRVENGAIDHHRFGGSRGVVEGVAGRRDEPNGRQGIENRVGG